MPPPKRKWYILNKDVTVSGIFARELPKTSRKGTVVYTENEKASSTNLVKVYNVDDEKSSYPCEKKKLEYLATEADAKWLIAVPNASDRWDLFKDDIRWRNRFLMAKAQRVKVKKLDGTDWILGVIRSIGSLRDKKGTWIQVETSTKEDGSFTRHTVSVPLSNVQIDEQKWSCPKCTLFNLPYRPGCLECSTPRPDDYYVIPEDYIPTQEEQRLIGSLNQEIPTVEPEPSQESRSSTTMTKVVTEERDIQESPAIKVKLYFEDRFESGTFIVMKLNPSSRLDYVKRLLFSQLNIPPEVQCWIVKKKVPQDFDTLRESGVSSNGDVAYIYIKVPTTGHISTERPTLSDSNDGTTRGISPSAPPLHDLEQDDASRALECTMIGNTNEAVETNTHSLYRVPLELEDRQSCGLPLFVHISLTDTFAKMKENIEKQWQLQRNWQRLMVGNIAPKDSDTLDEHGVEALLLQGQPIYLYIKNQRIKPASIETPRAAMRGNPQSVPGSSRKINNRESQNQNTTRKAKISRPLITPSPRPSSTRNRPKLTRPTTAKRRESGWDCPGCTFRNLPLRPGCELCGAERPPTYVVPRAGKVSDREQKIIDQEKQAQEQMNVAMASEDRIRQEEAQQNYAVIQQASTERVIYTTEEEECAICIDVCPAGQGIRLKECLHVFCKGCLEQHIKLCNEAAIPCPDSTCKATITEAEIKQIVSEDVYRKFHQRSLQVAEGTVPNSFHCKTADCTGWCVYEDTVNTFMCPVCNKSNCLTCKVIHEGMNCKQYQDEIAVKAKNDKEARATQQQIEGMLQSGEAMKCPSCKIVVQKKEGCDWVQCTMCKTELCWATRGPRWGPKGYGDTTGGCRCGVNGQRCHRYCQNCH